MIRLFEITAFLLVASFANARPATFNDYLAADDDLASVGSLRREIRAPPPAGFAIETQDLLSAGNAPKKSHGNEKHIKNASGKTDEGGYYKTYGSDADGEKGYYKETYGKGDHGYKTLDTFHKKDGDKYGFEKHTAYGKGHGGHQGGGEAKSASYSKKDGEDDHDGAGTIVESHYAESDGGDSGESGYYSEGAGDGEAGSGEHYGDGGSGESSYARSSSYSTGNEGDGEGGGYYEEDDHY